MKEYSSAALWLSAAPLRSGLAVGIGYRQPRQAQPAQWPCADQGAGQRALASDAKSPLLHIGWLSLSFSVSRDTTSRATSPMPPARGLTLSTAWVTIPLPRC